MSFHIHVLKNNPFKFARLNTVPLNNDFLEKRIDNIVKTEEDQMYNGKRRKKLPDKNIKQTMPAMYWYDQVLSKSVQALSTTQALPGLYRNDTWNSNTFKMSDMERIMTQASTDKRSLTTDDIYRSYTHTYFRPTDYTILSDSVISKENVSISLYKTEQLKNLLSEMNRIKSEMDKMRKESMFQSTVGDGCLDLSSGIGNVEPPSQANPSPEKGGPSQQQLNDLKNILIEEAPQFFQGNPRNDYCHENITFENNFFSRKRVTHGIKSYNMEMFVFRSMGRLYYSSPKMEILAISSHVENGTVIARWRVAGIPQLRALTFWKPKQPEDITWHDGVSTFYLKDDGLVHLHKLERVLVDREVGLAKTSKFAKAIAIAIGIVPKPSVDFNTFWMKKTNSVQK